MAAKKQKNGRRGVSQGKCEAAGRIVLVGTYKGDQLTKWRGWYNYPVGNGEHGTGNGEQGTGNRERGIGNRERGIGNGAGGSQLVATENADAMNCVPPDFSQVNELWLFKGTRDERRYKAEFVGIKTREELIRDYGYPGGR